MQQFYVFYISISFLHVRRPQTSESKHNILVQTMGAAESAVAEKFCNLNADQLEALRGNIKKVTVQDGLNEHDFQVIFDLCLYQIRPFSSSFHPLFI